MLSFHRKMGCINKRERGVRLWSLIGRCVKHFGAQVTDMIEFGSSAIVCWLPAGRLESALMCISELRACARSVRSSLHLCAHNHCLLCILNEKKRCAAQVQRCMQHSKYEASGNRRFRWVGQIVTLSWNAGSTMVLFVLFKPPVQQDCGVMLTVNKSFCGPT